MALKNVKLVNNGNSFNRPSSPILICRIILLSNIIHFPESLLIRSEKLERFVIYSLIFVVFGTKMANVHNTKRGSISLYCVSNLTMLGREM